MAKTSKSVMPKFCPGIRTAVAVIVAGLLMAGAAAEAYVLHGYHLLDLMAEALGTSEIKGLRLEQQVIVPPSETAGAESEFDEVAYYRFPGEFRSQISSRQFERIHVYRYGRSITVIDGRTTAETENDFDRYKDRFLFNSRQLRVERLPQLGIDPTISRLGRFQGRLAYVVGGRYPDETRPQIWLDKESFRPFRWIIRPSSFSDPAAGLEVRFYGWRQVDEVWLPLRMEFYQADRLVRVLQIERVRINPDMDETLFNIERLRASYPPGGSTRAAGSTETGEKSEVQETLDRFRRIFE